MARENQGLQIALIIFVILTLLLGVTTFLFFKSYDEATQTAKKQEEEANTQRATARQLIEKNNELKEMMGFKAEDAVDKIREYFNEDMTKFAGNFPEEERFYHQLVKGLHSVIVDKNAELDSKTTEIAVLKAYTGQTEIAAQEQVKQHEKAAGDARDDLAGEREKFKTDWQLANKEKKDVAGRLKKAKETAQEKMATLDGTIRDLEGRLARAQVLYTRAKEEFNKVVKESFEVADGEVSLVSQRNGSVYVNLGHADSLNRQTTFSVYPIDVSDVTAASKKASIEVTQILGDHLAEARIIEDDPSNPIVPGDKIYTPLWSPGDQIRFGLTGVMDVNGDGKSDQQVVRNLITINGGLIDAETDPTGKRTGRMSPDTRYLILGDKPSDKDNPDLIDAYGKMTADAARLGVEKIQLRELLLRMGWKNQTPVTTFGRGANAKDFRALPPEGSPRRSTGSVTPLFKSRQPPARR